MAGFFCEYTSRLRSREINEIKEIKEVKENYHTAPFYCEKAAFAALHCDNRAAHIRYSMLRARFLVCLATTTF